MPTSRAGLDLVGAAASIPATPGRGPLNAVPELRLVNLFDPNGGLKDGDAVALKEWVRAAGYDVPVWRGG
ncbi:hypothetical protein OL229_01040 [Neisseriaceae bacterium JH1-16]|nr:hypothetical protein [Neisseriaceae bacterium JH1-16]